MFAMLDSCLFFCWLNISYTRGDAPLLGHHARMPRWVPHDLHVHLGHSVKVEERRSHALRYAFVHRATGRRQRHHDGHVRAIDVRAVHQPQVDNVTAQLGINDLAQRFQDEFFGDGIGYHK